MCAVILFRKKGEIVTDDIVFDTEEAVAHAVKMLNESNGSYFPKDEPDDWHDEDWMDCNYYYYTEARIVSVQEVLRRDVLFKR